MPNVARKKVKVLAIILESGLPLYYSINKPHIAENGIIQAIAVRCNSQNGGAFHAPREVILGGSWAVEILPLPYTIEVVDAKSNEVAKKLNW